jgi:hypothetical protein
VSCGTVEPTAVYRERASLHTVGNNQDLRRGLSFIRKRPEFAVLT